MTKTEKGQASYYLTLLITVAALAVAILSFTHDIPSAGGSEAPATVQATSNPVRGRYNGKIVFTSDRHNRALSIWSMNPDGSSPTRLTDDTSRTEKLPSFSPVYDGSPVWSPDGTKIAFISNRNYLFSLYVMNADGSNAQLVTNKVLDPGAPAWSPDGRKIAFSSGTRITFGSNKPWTDIYLINVDGSGLTQLTRDSGLNDSPTWSPDGKQIAFSSNRDAGNQSKIWVMNADGSNQREIPNSHISRSSGFYGLQPAWSPDGTKILFTHYRVCRGTAAFGIYVMNADGSNTRLLTNDPNSCSGYSSPRWSPDGTKIVASVSPETRNPIDSAPQIIVMNADGSNQINISNRGRYYFNTGLSTHADVQADWQPLLTPLNLASSVVGFSAPSYTVYEDVGTFPITVKRTSNLNDVASCSYVTLTEITRIHDPAASGTLRFAPDESSKTISIAVNDSRGTGVNSSYKILLSDNEGNATFVGGIKEATLNILIKDTASRKKNHN